MLRVGVVGCRFNTRRFIEGLLNDGIPVNLLITLDQDVAVEATSGYENLIDFAKSNEIEVYATQQYTLGQKQRQYLERQHFDIVFCVGWQRLLPEWFLDLSRLGVFGMHGSCYKLPRGRGRSPQVWSIIKGATEYYSHIFQYATGADDGKLLHVETFDITPFDTAASIQVKNQLIFNRTIREMWPEIEKGTLGLLPQVQDVEPTYFPKRTPDDGLIQWHQGADEIANFIRAQTRPYPGAFSWLENNKIHIWKAHVFDTKLIFEEDSGLIVDVIKDLGFLVQTKDFPLLVTEWSGGDPVPGLTFNEAYPHD